MSKFSSSSCKLLKLSDTIMSSRKRSLEEVKRFDDFSKPIPNASVHGSLLSLSGVEPGRHSNFFDGVITDGIKKLSVMGFRTEQHKKLQAFYNYKTVLHLSNCEVKKSRQGEQMEVMLNSTTQILDSPKTIDVDADVEQYLHVCKQVSVFLQSN